VADRILGTQFLEDIAEFFILFQSMYDGFVERARAVTALLGSPQATFLVVSTLEVSPAREAEFFLEVLAERKYHVGALILNKVLPEFLLSRAGADAARAMTKEAAAITAAVAPALPSPAQGSEDQRDKHLTHMLTEIGASFLNYQVVARREAEQRSELSSSPELTLSVPYFEEDIHSLAGLLRLGEQVWR
jgi:anion-transporting  ArsA/GET3 family ATPase